MRVVVNHLAALGQRTGIGHYTVQLLRCLRAQASPGEIATFPEGWLRQARALGVRLRPRLEGKGNGTPASVLPTSSFLTNLRREVLQQLRQCGRAVTAAHFRASCARHQYDLYHEPNFIPLPCDRSTVATIHDLSALLHPEWHPADRVAHFEKHFRRGIAGCAHFFAISEFGRQEIIRTLNLPPERVTRTYMGIRPGLSPLPRETVAQTLKQLGLPPQYLLYLGTIEPRKNVLTLLRAYCSLPDKLRSQWPLLLVGGWGWNAADVADYLHREARHRGVVHLGYLAEEHVAAVYNGARALVYPSRYEGFGLPPIEMMACGGAVLASTAGAVAETVGRRAYLVDPDDLDGWRDALQRVVMEDEWWSELRRGVEEVARPFTWEQCATDTLRVYHMLNRHCEVMPTSRRIAA